MEESATRRKRINRLKKMILGGVMMAVLIPVTASIILSVRVHQLSGRIRQQEAVIQELEDENKNLAGAFFAETIEESEREALQEEQDTETPEAGEEEESQKKIYLTFDDGPSSNTDEILDILKAYDVKATFFVVGKTDEASRKAYRRIVEEGHTLGMHSYSHSYEDIYDSEEDFQDDMKKLQEYLYELTGVWPRFYRFPGGSSNTVSNIDMQKLADWLTDQGVTYFDWNVASGDAVSRELPAETLLANCLAGIRNQQSCVVLMHDAANKDTTVEALPEIISEIRLQEDAVFLPITDDTVPVQHTIKAQTEESN